MILLDTNVLSETLRPSPDPNVVAWLRAVEPPLSAPYADAMSSAANKTQRTDVPVGDFLATVDERRRAEAETLIPMMGELTGEEPYMYGPSIIGFGTRHYVYDSGREGDMPVLSFSPRNSAVTVYVNDGFDGHEDLLAELGRHRTSKACLYLTRLENADLDVLKRLLARSVAAQKGRQ